MRVPATWLGVTAETTGCASAESAESAKRKSVAHAIPPFDVRARSACPSVIACARHARTDPFSPWRLVNAIVPKGDFSIRFLSELHITRTAPISFCSRHVGQHPRSNQDLSDGTKTPVEDGPNLVTEMKTNRVVWKSINGYGDIFVRRADLTGNRYDFLQEPNESTLSPKSSDRGSRGARVIHCRDLRPTCSTDPGVFLHGILLVLATHRSDSFTLGWSDTQDHRFYRKHTTAAGSSALKSISCAEFVFGRASVPESWERTSDWAIRWRFHGVFGRLCSRVNLPAPEFSTAEGADNADKGGSTGSKPCHLEKVR